MRSLTFLTDWLVTSKGLGAGARQLSKFKVIHTYTKKIPLFWLFMFEITNDNQKGGFFLCIKLKMLLSYCFICSALVVTACNKDIPEPETIEEKNIVPVSDPIIYTFQPLDQQTWSLQQFVKNGTLYVECIAPGISFTGKDTKKEKGKILVFIDGEKKGEYQRAAFQVKNVPKGKSEITVKIITVDGQTFGEEKNFKITNP